jgi:predicted hotdog family 3-hydroxylacyl-ACP dehydratase
MRLLETLRHYDEKSATCVVTLNESSPFMRQGRVNALVSMEYLAQCVAAYATIHPAEAEDGITKDQASKLAKPRIGYLVGVRRLELKVEHFFPGDALTVTVTHIWGGPQGAQFQGNVERDGELVAAATLTVFVPPNNFAGQA